MTTWSKAVTVILLILLTVGLIGILSLPHTMFSLHYLTDFEQDITRDVMLTEQEPVCDLYAWYADRITIEYLRTNESPITIELHSEREGGSIVSIRNVTEISGARLIFLLSDEPDITACFLKREVNDTSVAIQYVLFGHRPHSDVYYSWINPFSLLGFALTYISFRKLLASARIRSMMLALLFVIIASALMTPIYVYYYNGDYHLITKETSEGIESFHFELNSSTPAKSLIVPIETITENEWLRIEVFTQNASVLSRFTTSNGSDVLTLDNLEVAAPNYFGFDIVEADSAELTFTIQISESETEVDVRFLTMMEVVEPQVDSDYPSALFRLGLIFLATGILIASIPIGIPTKRSSSIPVNLK
ncbi:MAG: hypothetical protein ACFFD6_07915 [Candidatus Thorarchaeota archaeon]